MKNIFSIVNNKESALSILILLFLLTFFLPFFMALKVILMGLLCVYILFYNSFSEKLSLFLRRRHTWLMSGFTIMLLVSLLLSDNTTSGLRFLQLRLPLIIFPLTIGLVYLPARRRNHILLGIAAMITISCAASLGYAIYRATVEQNSAWLYNDALSLFIGQQSVYTSVFVNISIYVFAFFLFFSNDYSKYRSLMVPALVLLLITSYLLASRSMMIFLYASALFFFLFYMIKKKKYAQGLALFSGFAVAILLVYKFFPSTFNRFRELAYTQFNYTSKGTESHYAGELNAAQWNGANFRLAAWQCGWQLFKEHPLAGTGLGDKEDALNKVYADRGFQFAIDTKKNVHNNYLDILLSLGVAGLLLFLAGWIILPFLTLLRQRDGLGIIILLTFVFAMITEVYFDRSLGGLVFGFFIPFLLTPYSNKKSKN